MGSGRQLDDLGWLETPSVECRTETDPPQVVMAGAIDLQFRYSLSAARATLDHHDSRDVLVDVRAVTLLTGTGLGFLAAVACRCRERGGTLFLLGPRPAVTRVLGLTGVDHVVTIVEHLPLPPRDRDRPTGTTAPRFSPPEMGTQGAVETSRFQAG